MGYLGTKPANTVVNSDQIADGAVGTADLANNAVTPAKLSAGAPTWDSSSNLGIGTSSPSARLDVNGVPTASTPAARFWGNNGGGSIQSLTGLSVYGNVSNGFVDTTLVYGNTANSYLAIGNHNGTSYAERMRIDSSGNLLVGASSQFSGFVANARLYVESPTSDYTISFRNTNATPYGVAISYSTTPNNGTSRFLDARDSSAQRFGVYSNGGIQNYQANNVNLSDAREKTNIELAGSYLDKICSIPVKTFNYIDQNLDEDDGLTLGVIAQDVEAVAPELVAESNWGTEEEPKMRLSIYQTDLQYALMKSIQELKAEVDSLKAQLSNKE